jgi:hypothetical protein
MPSLDPKSRFQSGLTRILQPIRLNGRWGQRLRRAALSYFVAKSPNGAPHCPRDRQYVIVSEVSRGTGVVYLSHDPLQARTSPSKCITSMPAATKSTHRAQNVSSRGAGHGVLHRSIDLTGEENGHCYIVTGHMRRPAGALPARTITASTMSVELVLKRPGRCTTRTAASSATSNPRIIMALTTATCGSTLGSRWWRTRKSQRIEGIAGGRRVSRGQVDRSDSAITRTPVLAAP